MRERENKKVLISTKKAILALLLAIAVLVAAQSLAMVIANLTAVIGLPALFGNIIMGVIYPLLTLAGVSYIVKKVLKLTLKDVKITKPGVTLVWSLAAFVMPLAVSGVLLLTKGHWDNTSMSSSETWAVVTGAVFYYGLATGIVEEVIFRGIIMSVLEYRWNKRIAILVPSVFFGALHILGNKLDILSIIQLLAAGTVVGILFSLVTYESGSIWCSALIHGIWNTIMIGGILNIGVEADERSLFSYVLDSKSFLITGGDFGVEASIISVIAYLMVIILALFLLKRRKKI